MPAYDQIQTYLEIGSEFGVAIDQCRSFLNHLGWLDLDIQTRLENCEWEGADYGFVYSGATGREVRAHIGGDTLDVRIGLLGWTPEFISALTTNCLELDFLLISEDIEDDLARPRIRYLPSAVRPIWYLVQEMWKFFPDGLSKAVQ